MRRRVSFDCERILTETGFTWVPFARVEIGYAGRRVETEMIVDSGADLTMIPHRLGVALGMGPKSLAPRTLAGIGGGIPYLLQRVTLRIGPLRMHSRIAWAQRDEVPVLLGRVDVLDRLMVTLDGKRHRVTFSE